MSDPMKKLIIGGGEFEIVDEAARAGLEASVITPEMYGAVGDGVTDDTEAIQDCIDDNPNANIVFGDGIYRVTDTITIHAGYVAQTIMLGMIVYDGVTNENGAVIDIANDITSTTGAFGGITLIGGSISCNWKMGTGIRNNAFSTRVISTSIRYYTKYGIDNGSDSITSRSNAISSSFLLESCMITQYPAQTGTAIRLIHSDNKIVNCNINGCSVGIELRTGGNFIANTHFTVCGQDVEEQDAASAFIYNNPFNTTMNELNTFSNCYFNGFAPKYVIKNATNNAMSVAINDGGIILGATSYTKKTYLCSSNYTKVVLNNVNVRHSKGNHALLGIVRFTGAAAPLAYNSLSINDKVASTQASNCANTCDLSNASKNPRVAVSSSGSLNAHTLRRIGYVVESSNFVGMAEFIVYISASTIIKLYVSNTSCFKTTTGGQTPTIDFYVDSSSSLVSDDEFDYRVRGLYVYNSTSSAYTTGVYVQIGDQPYPSVQSFLWDYHGSEEIETTDLSAYTLISETQTS